MLQLMKIIFQHHFAGTSDGSQGYGVILHIFVAHNI